MIEAAEDKQLKKTKQENKPHIPVKKDSCATFSDFRRPNYYFGQLLSTREFIGEQDYFRRKLMLHNRCLHGYGVVCGLEITPVPREQKCDPRIEDQIRTLEDELRSIKSNPAQNTQKLEAIHKRLEELKKEMECQEPAEPTLVEVQCGIAYDCQGQELILTRPRRIDLWNALSTGDQKRYKDHAETTKQILPLYLSICYCEQPIEPSRPAAGQECGPAAACVYGWTRESVRFLVTLDPPEEDTRCETCCEPCCGHEQPCGSSSTGGDCCCLLLARFNGFYPTKPLMAAAIDNWVRRPLTTYVTTKVKGVSWAHGATYSLDNATTILGNEGDTKSGFVVEFTRPVLAETITEGVIDVWVIQGPRGAAAQIQHLEGEFVDKPDSGPITRVQYRRLADDSPDPGDRVLIQVRTNFILDACCRAVDGENLGGRVPLLDEFNERLKWDKTKRPKPVCVSPPPGHVYAPWKSGNGNEGGDFTSWFFVEHTQRKPKGGYQAP